MTITKNQVVSLSYQLTVDGEVVDTATAEQPLEFIFGSGMLLPKFEANIDGKTVGDAFKFSLTAAEGYGEVDEKAIMPFPLDMFMIDGKLEEDLLVEGNVIPMQDNTGRIVQGTVLEVNDEGVTLDFNHPLAGMELNFEGKIIALREATEKELQKGHVCGCGDSCDCDDEQQGGGCGCGCQ
ncbi:MAG: peptidylprolyl isomerase [Prevotellaceae bacterium]|jgi:FKBP-type peptidyl-prolyl cis-trans isomerase SlyD|nr:peptidylprolyl isomerase [Prevotellaceae bacterium]